MINNKKIFIICPVRKNLPPWRGVIYSLVKRLCPDFRDKHEKTQERIADYVKKLEASGCAVHWPPRDTDQSDDGIGYRICFDNMTAILRADEIHIWYDPKSSGSFFDFGGTFMLVAMLKYKKRIVLININSKEAKRTEHKSFINVVRHIRA